MSGFLRACILLGSSLVFGDDVVLLLHVYMYSFFVTFEQADFCMRHSEPRGGEREGERELGQAPGPMRVSQQPTQCWSLQTD